MHFPISGRRTMAASVVPQGMIIVKSRSLVCPIYIYTQTRTRTLQVPYACSHLSELTAWLRKSGNRKKSVVTKNKEMGVMSEITDGT